MGNVIESKQVKAQRIKQKLLARQLPHLNSHKFYPWMRRYWESKNKIDIVVCPNQVGKSSSQIRRLIHRCTEDSLWPELWPNLFKKNSPIRYPSTHWYLYPTLEMATREFEEKWKLYLPKKEQRNSQKFGWQPIFEKNLISQIRFNSGPKIYFLSYAMGRTKLQSASVHSLNLDEEPPQKLFDELVKRISATEGYLSMVFTATEAQQFWIDVVETKKHVIPDSNIIQVSLFDCQVYEDGTVSLWTKEKIEREIALCSTDRQVQRRVYGRIVKDEGLKYESFDRRKNLKPYHPLPSDWIYYFGIDAGGGGTAHPAAIGGLAVSPDYDKARLIRGWRGDGVDTTAEDILNVYRMMIATLPMPPVQTTYDWAAKDLMTIASRMGLALVPAEKSHALGEHTLNTLFKTGALVLFEKPSDSELPFPEEYLQTQKVIWELESLTHDTPKNRAKDDAIDGWLRYIVTKVPWNWEKICGTLSFEDIFIPEKVQIKTREEELRYDIYSKNKETRARAAPRSEIEEEIEEWNSAFNDDF